MSDRTQSTAAQENRARDSITMLLAQAEGKRVEFSKLLPSTISWETFKDTFKIAIQTRPSLLDADRTSLWIALQQAAMDGLMPDGREGALVIFNEEVDEDGNPIASKGTKQKSVVWMKMIRGLLKLARNTGEVTTMRAVLIYEGETFMMTDVDGTQSYRHERRMGADFDDSDKAIVGAYAVINFKDGSWDMEPMSRAQIERVRAVSKAKSAKAPWQQWYGEQSKKTVLRRLLKRQDSASVARIEAAMDRDESLTIDGDPVEEQRQVAAPVAPSSPAAPKPKPPASDEDPANASLGKKVATASGPVQEEGGQKPADASGPAQDQQQPPSGQTSATAQQGQRMPAFEHGATDEFGEPVLDVGEDGIFRTPGHFASWFATAAGTTRDIENLFENNSDALGDAAKIDPEAGAVIMDALAKARAKPAPVDSTPATSDSAPASEGPKEEAGPQPLAVPTGPTGRRNWGQYWPAAKTAIYALKSVAEIDAWEVLNEPVYRESKTIAQSATELAAVRRKEFEPKPDRDRGYADDYLAAIKTAQTRDEVKKIDAGAAFQSQMPRWERERPELHAEVLAAMKKRIADLTAP